MEEKTEESPKTERKEEEEKTPSPDCRAASSPSARTSAPAAPGSQTSPPSAGPRGPGVPWRARACGPRAPRAGGAAGGGRSRGRRGRGARLSAPGFAAEENDAVAACCRSRRSLLPRYLRPQCLPRATPKGHERTGPRLASWGRRTSRAGSEGARRPWPDGVLVHLRRRRCRRLRLRFSRRRHRRPRPSPGRWPRAGVRTPSWRSCCSRLPFFLRSLARDGK